MKGWVMLPVPGADLFFHTKPLIEPPSGLFLHWALDNVNFHSN